MPIISKPCDKHITYNKLIAGVAPGGAVSVWLSGIDKTTEIFFGQAEKADVDWKVIVNNPNISREEYLQLGIKESLSPEAFLALQKNGIPLDRWETYHQKRYHWQPVFTNVDVRDKLIYTVKYYNGEVDYLYVPLEESLAKIDRGVPSDLHFVWERSGGQDLVLKLDFNEQEIFYLFDKLGSKKQQVYLEIKMVMVEKREHFYFLLRNDDEEIYLKHTQVKTYGAGKPAD